MNISCRHDRSNPSDPAQPRRRGVRFSTIDRVALIPSRKDLTQKEIRRTWISQRDIEQNEDEVAADTIKMRKQTRRRLSFIDDNNGTTFRGIEHLLSPSGSTQQKRGRHLLVDSTVHKQRRDTNGWRIVNEDELALMSRMLSKDATDRARARGIEYERAEMQCVHSGTQSILHNIIKNLEEELVPPRHPQQHLRRPQQLGSSASCPNLMSPKTHLRQARKSYRHQLSPSSSFSWSTNIERSVHVATRRRPPIYGEM